MQLQPLDDGVQPAQLLLGGVHEFVRAVQCDVHGWSGDGQVGGGDVSVAFCSVVIEENDLESLGQGGGRVAAPRDVQLLQPALNRRRQRSATTTYLAHINGRSTRRHRDNLRRDGGLRPGDVAHDVAAQE